MTDVLLNLRFKGDRDYLHGTDMFNETMTCLQSEFGPDCLHDIDFSIHHLARSQLSMHGQPPSAGIDPVAVCAFTTSTGRHRKYLVETDEPVGSRYAYPEDEMVKTMEMDLNVRQGILRETTSYSDIEVWVAMTKALHYQVFPNLVGKWMFVRGRFTRYVGKTQANEQKIVISSCFNDKFTRSEILNDGVKAGDIYFSIV